MGCFEDSFFGCSLMFHVKCTVFSLCMPIKQACESAVIAISENCRALVARQLLQRRIERLKIYLAHFRRCRMREIFLFCLQKLLGLRLSNFCCMLQNLVFNTIFVCVFRFFCQFISYFFVFFFFIFVLLFFPFLVYCL